MSEATLILDQARRGEPGAAERLLPLVYEELRRIAAAKLAYERAAHTLQPTALVHEAWLRLGGGDRSDWQNRRHFLGAAAEAMRRILIDRARHRLAVRHGGGLERVDLDRIEIPGLPTDDRILALGEALGRLEELAPEKAELVKLRFFTGLTLEQAAEAMEISPATGKRWWAYSRAWLMRELEAADPDRD